MHLVGVIRLKSSTKNNVYMLEVLQKAGAKTQGAQKTT